jgi:hypothetical protein
MRRRPRPTGGLAPRERERKKIIITLQCTVKKRKKCTVEVKKLRIRGSYVED